MLRNVLVIALGVMIATSASLAAQEARHAARLSSPLQASARNAVGPAVIGGAPQNRWRYRYSNGRWWYQTAENRWSYYDGNRWRPYSAGSGALRRPVDPALLRLEYKEGSLGRRRWPRSGMNRQGGGAGTLPLSGTQGSMGGSPSGSFTNIGGVPSGMNSSIGTSTGVGGLGRAGRAVSGGGLVPSTGGSQPR